MSRPQIFLRDLLHALDELAVDSPATGNAVLRMLSLESARELARPTPEAEPKPQPHAESRAPARSPDPPPAGPSSAPSTSEARGLQGGRELRAGLQRVDSAAAPATRPAWLDTVAPLTATKGTYDAPLDPLIDPRQARSVLSGVASGVARDGELDLELIVESLARLEPLPELPRKREWSLRRGLQILVDESPSMAPFAADAAQLVRRMHAFLPADAIHVLHFVGTPLRECWSASEAGEFTWSLPPRSAPVLLLSTLGAGAGPLDRRSASPAEWLEFAEHAADAPLRALVPFPLSRFSTRVVRALRAIAWDRRTSAATVRRILSARDR